MAKKQLLVLRGPDKDRVFDVNADDVLLLGRSRATTSRLTDPHVSRVHCEITLEGRDVYVNDFESASGTYVNGERVQRKKLTVGDVILIGETELSLQPSDLAEASTVPVSPEDVKKYAIPRPTPPAGISSAETKETDAVRLPADRHWHPVLVGAAALFAGLVLALGGRSLLQSPTTAPNGDRGLHRTADDDRQPPEASSAGDLYVLSIGVSKYRDPTFNLAVAHKDAEAVTRAFGRQAGGKLFEKIICELLTDEHARKQDIVTKLGWLKRQVTQNDLALVTLSGHGARDFNDDFFFMPHDYDPQLEPTLTGIYWDDFKRYLGTLPCRVIIVLDTCHSGLVTKHLSRSEKNDQATLRREVAQAVKHFEQSEKGMVVMAACLSREKAQEKPEWGHGALTLALLEGLTGHRYYAGKSATPLPSERPDFGGVVTLQDLDGYVSRRVRELAGENQAVVTNHTGNINLDHIRVSVVER